MPDSPKPSPGRLAIKVDVDTLMGLKQGVPALLEILNNRGIRASFFVALGPDNSGRAIFRVFSQRGFWEKMWRTRAPAPYGLRTLLYGLLLPAPLICQAAGEVLPRVTAAGHELGLHGWDHVNWHDRLGKMTRETVAREVNWAQQAFINLMGHPARAYAAPGWQATLTSREVLAEAGFLYASDTRGTSPYLPRFGHRISSLLEIPTTLPTLDELLGFNGCTPEDFNALILHRLQTDKPQVLTIHAELEGGAFREAFARLLDRCLAKGVTFFRLEDWARELLTQPRALPSAPVFQGRLPGRAGTVTRQGVLEG